MGEGTGNVVPPCPPPIRRWIYDLLLLIVALIVRFSVCSMFFCVLLCVLSSFAIILMGKTEACFALFVFLASCGCYCSAALPHGAVGWSAVCDCGIS